MDLSELSRIVGAENVIPGETSGRAVSGVKPAAVAAPATPEEAAAVLLHAAEQGWSVVPAGGGTFLDCGLPPARVDLLLSTGRMDRVVDYQPDDMTVTVQPGVTLEALGRVLAERGQFLPLDPPFPARATAGGTVAAAKTGPWRAAFGTPRDWLIGCRVVGADGKEVRGGGQVVKNVAGYDLPKLYTGAFGTLGLLTELTFKVMPVPETSGACRVGLPTAAAAEAFLAAVQGSDLQPAALELVLEEGSSPWRLFLQYLSAREGVEWQLEETRRLAGAAGASFEPVGAADAEAELRALRDAAYSMPFLARLATVSGRAAELAGAARDAAGQAGAAARVQAHAATGQVLVSAEGDLPAGLPEALRGAAARHGARCALPRIPGSWIGQVDPWGEPGPEVRLLRGLKEALDPRGLFSPGRFVGRL